MDFNFDLFHQSLPSEISSVYVNGYVRKFQKTKLLQHVPKEVIKLIHSFFGCHQKFYIQNQQSIYKGDQCIAISIGNTNICVAAYLNKSNIKIIPNEWGEKNTPCYISFRSNNQCIVGYEAKKSASQYPHSTIFDLHKLLKNKISDINIKQFPFTIKYDHITQMPLVEVKYNNKTKTFTVQQLYTMILQKIRHMSQQYLGITNTNNPLKTVITMPSQFNDTQKQIIKDAATYAGLDVMKIICEQHAAIAAHKIDKQARYYEQKVFVFDLGASSLKTSVMSIDDGVSTIDVFMVDETIGGKNFDNILLQHCIRGFKRKHKQSTNQDITTNQKIINKLLIQCQKAKHALSQSTCATVDIESLVNGLDFCVSITRARFEYLCKGIVAKCMKQIDDMLVQNNLCKQDIHRVIMCGGNTQLPMINRMITTYFDNTNKIYGDLYGDLIVRGAAIFSNTLFNRECDCLVSSMTVLDIGIETGLGIMTKILSRNNFISCKNSMIFTVSNDNVKGVLIKIYEGQRIFVKDNYRLAEFELMFKEKQSIGIAQIEVIIKIDQNYILNVIAKDLNDKDNCKHIRLDYFRMHPHNCATISESNEQNMRVITNINNAETFLVADRNKLQEIEKKQSFMNFIKQIKNRLNKAQMIVDNITRDNSDDIIQKKKQLQKTILETILSKSNYKQFDLGGMPGMMGAPPADYDYFRGPTFGEID
eukprot:310168_1